jgi:hypothetical protein
MVSDIPAEHQICSTDNHTDSPQIPNTPEAGKIDPLVLHVKEAIATIGRLEALGLQRYNIPLPKCIVLGE